jgi:DNA-binding NarL/FixJ family response regulator
MPVNGSTGISECGEPLTLATTLTTSSKGRQPFATKGAVRRIVVADDHPVCRYGLQRFFNEQPDLTCSAEAGTAGALISVLAAVKLDLVAMGLRFADHDGVDLIKTIRDHYPALPILVFSGVEESAYAERTLRAGACGFVRKNEPLAELLNAVHCVLEGGLYLSAKMSALIFHKAFRNNYAGDSSVKALSDRELYVFQLVGAGLASRKIATQLGVSLKTIESHRENIKRKLGFRDGAELMRHAFQFADTPHHVLAQPSLPSQRASHFPQRHGSKGFP